MRVVYTPVFAGTGELVATPGYHLNTGIFVFAPPDLDGFLESIGDIANPSKDDLQGALEVLLEPLCDFPFVSQADRAHTLALILLPFVRELIDGPTPLHGIFKPAPGTGGTLLAEIVNLVAELWDLVERSPELNLGFDRTKDRTSQKTSFGQQLVSRHGQMFGAYRLAEAGERHRAKQWRLELVHEQSGEPGEPSSDPPGGYAHQDNAPVI
jgi:hypothetical protein